MLYDNALLLSTLSEAYALTKEDRYADTIDQTVAFVINELTTPEGAFYSSIDADSEGKEGKFYVWSRQEIENVLGEEADLFCQVYDVWEDGNWEKTNILWKRNKMEKVALQNEIALSDLQERMMHCREKCWKYATSAYVP